MATRCGNYYDYDDPEVNNEHSRLAVGPDDYRDEGSYYDDSDFFCRTSTQALHCTLCCILLRSTSALLDHILSAEHNLLLDMAEKAKRSMAMLKSMGKRKLLNARVTRKMKMRKVTAPEEKELGEITDSDEEEVCTAVPEKPLPLTANKVDSKPLDKVVPTNPQDLRNTLNHLKERQQEDKKLEKRKKKNQRTREAKKRNKRNAKEEKKRIEQALEALEEEDDDVAYIKKTMGFTKFQTTKTGYF